MWSSSRDVPGHYGRIIPSVQLLSESGRSPWALEDFDPRGQQKREDLEP